MSIQHAVRVLFDFCAPNGLSRVAKEGLHTVLSVLDITEVPKPGFTQRRERTPSRHCCDGCHLMVKDWWTVYGGRWTVYCERMDEEWKHGGVPIDKGVG